MRVAAEYVIETNFENQLEPNVCASTPVQLSVSHYLTEIRE